MSVTVEVLFESPQREIASVLQGLYAECERAWLVSGFMTAEGAEALRRNVASNPAKLQALVVGAATWRAFDAFDALLAAGADPASMRVHLGHSRPTGVGAKHKFYRYHPMLHSKVYLFQLPDREAAAVIGSHNLTGFALHGLNGEAATLLRGNFTDKVFEDVRAHVEAAVVASVQYDPASRDAFAWWASQFVEGFAAKFADMPRDGDPKKTIIILAENGIDTPSVDDVVYFELPAALGKVQSLSAEVHIYLFDKLPPNPRMALTQLSAAKKSLWCVAIGIEDDRGGKELQADWFIQNPSRPKLMRAGRPFRPKPAAGMQQVRVRARELFGRFEYIFDAGRASFEPIFDDLEVVQLPEIGRSEALESQIVPREDLPWFKVVGLKKRATADSPYTAALSAMSPDTGAYILLSTKRRGVTGS